MRLFDPGAQAERTALGWQRTGLGLLAVGALLANAAGHHDRTPELALAVLTGVVGMLVALVVAPLRYRQILTQVHATDSPLARRTCQLLSALIVVVALLGASLALRLLL